MTITCLTKLFLAIWLSVSVPPSKIEPVVDVMHGEEIVDNFRWLEALESENEEVREWTTAQNEYTRQVLDNLPGRVALEQRLGELMSVGSVSAPAMRGSLYFNTERKGDQNQPVLYLRHGPDGTPKELLNPNTLDDRGLYALDWYVPTEDGSLLAFGLSYAGDEMTVLHILDVETGMWLADEIPGKVEFGGWMPDNKGFLYGKLDDPEDAYSRSYYFHKLGRHYSQDPLLFSQEEPSRIPAASLSRDGRWIIVVFFEGWSKQDIYYVETDEWKRTGNFNPMPIAEGLDARFSPQFVYNEMLFLLTTNDAPQGMLYGVDLNNPHQRNWKVFIPHRDDAVLKSAALAKDRIIATYEKDASTRLESFSLKGESLGEIALPGLGSAELRGSRDYGRSSGIATRYDRTEAYIPFESFNTPDSIYRIDLATGKQTIWAKPDVPVDSDSVIVKQEWCTSPDGTHVPMFIVHRKDLKHTGENPTVIYGYGGFNVSITPWFNPTYFPWYEGGGILVAANLRGGGEFGEAWHQAGMLGNKQNVYDDLYAIAEHLIAKGYTSPNHLSVLGGSNGGLLTGVAAIQRPDLWAGLVSAVPLLDMLRYHHFLMAKFWIPEYGDPENSEHYKFLKAYSPYHNFEAGQEYPALFFTAGENDNRVHPLHARKMTAALQSYSANDFQQDPILLWIDREGGHGQGKPLHLRIRERADLWIFLMWQTGMLPDE